MNRRNFLKAVGLSSLVPFGFTNTTYADVIQTPIIYGDTTHNRESRILELTPFDDMHKDGYKDNIEKCGYNCKSSFPLKFYINYDMEFSIYQLYNYDKKELYKSIRCCTSLLNPEPNNKDLYINNIETPLCYLYAFTIPFINKNYCFSIPTIFSCKIEGIVNIERAFLKDIDILKNQDSSRVAVRYTIEELQEFNKENFL